jgi:CheY-like chemotaxis protein
VFVKPDGRIELANARAGELLGFEPAAVAGMDMARLVSRLYAVGDGDSFVPTLQALLHDPWEGGSGDLQQPATGRVICTPLSAIVGTVQQMLDAGQDDAQLRRVRTSVEGLLALVGDILDFSKIESRKLTLDEGPLELREMLTDVVQLLDIRAFDKGLTLRMDVSDAVPDAIVGDAMRLRQVPINLIGNAIKFTEAGEVRLRVGVAHLLPGEVCLHFSVEDTGVGIPREKQELVFEAFAQADGPTARRYGGKGVGLSISAPLVELMGGDIWVESEPGSGAAFRFTAIFTLQGTEAPRPADGEADAARRDPRTVLIVEDEVIHRELLSALLLGRGHRVVTARNGREALTELSRHQVDIALMERKLVAIFLKQSPGMVESVRVAIEARDGDALRRAAHALRGMVSNFPPGPARGAAARMETIGFDDDLVAAHEVLPSLV